MTRGEYWLLSEVTARVCARRAQTYSGSRRRSDLRAGKVLHATVARSGSDGRTRTYSYRCSECSFRAERGDRSRTNWTAASHSRARLSNQRARHRSFERARAVRQHHFEDERRWNAGALARRGARGIGGGKLRIGPALQRARVDRIWSFATL